MKLKFSVVPLNLTGSVTPSSKRGYRSQFSKCNHAVRLTMQRLYDLIMQPDASVKFQLENSTIFCHKSNEVFCSFLVIPNHLENL